MLKLYSGMQHHGGGEGTLQARLGSVASRPCSRRPAAVGRAVRLCAVAAGPGSGLGAPPRFRISLLLTLSHHDPLCPFGRLVTS